MLLALVPARSGTWSLHSSRLPRFVCGADLVMNQIFAPSASWPQLLELQREKLRTRICFWHRPEWVPERCDSAMRRICPAEGSAYGRAIYSAKNGLVSAFTRAPNRVRSPSRLRVPLPVKILP